MNKIRTIAAVALVGVLLLVGGGVANASPPGPNPLGSLPEPLWPLAAVVGQIFADTWNFFAGIADLIMFGS
ncbi:hypothetical protein ERC79_19715 [Rhodococcus sp. ABRD24]|uniref:hypothetical protein n=1 Tax=Rhodococcus sp. ABRD24 TaxID=2507582 RepID=UPI00103AD78E|nr:hypothetical protein [Rhodococcus sp. ABRD24]QBJ97923.1 hypothetical protein ERC79_19715 [Rhodococcus sp. ABRD24]